MKQRAKFRGVDDNEDGTELNIKSSITNVPTTEITIKEDDTLQALSIRYHTPVAEIKRLNNLHRENEIFARRTIKVPYRAIAMAHKSGDNSPESPKNTKKSIDANILKEKLSNVPSTSKNNILVGNLIDIGDDLNETSSFNEIIFNTTIAHKTTEECADVDADDLVSDEEVQLLPNINITTEPTISEFSCNGADWGLTWPILLGIILILAFAGPIIYIFYIEEHKEKYHHNYHHTNTNTIHNSR